MVDLKYCDLITIENLFQAWNEFKLGKRKKPDVQEFERNLEDNLFKLHRLLKGKTYEHGSYQDFYVNDPKRRHIHKACVADRIVHHLLYKYLYQLFDKTFIYDSYSCRINKGTHGGIRRLANFVRRVSKNYTFPCFALKLDIKKFFSSVDHKILLELLRRKVQNPDILWLLEQVIESFSSGEGKRKGIPLGNLTSQVFANIYMNELDQFIKHKLKVKYYLRYADDFLILNSREDGLFQYINILKQYLRDDLKLELHPNKIKVTKLSWGIDFLGYVTLPHYILPRGRTVKRIFRKIKSRNEGDNSQSLQSYLGYLSHAKSLNLSQELKNQVWFLNR